MERKEAIKILKDFYDKSALFSIRTALDTVIPELKESEDERIRKELIKETEGSEVRLFEAFTNEEFIAWLKKKGEQKSAWSVVDEKMIDEIIDFFENGTVKLQHDLSLYASWLKYLKQRIGG